MKKDRNTCFQFQTPGAGARQGVPHPRQPQLRWAGGDRSPGIAGVILWCKGYVDAAIQCNTYRELHDFVQFARKPLGFICFFGVCPCFESGSHYVCRFE